MRKRYTRGAVALMAAIGATGALAAGSQSGGTIRFTGAVVATGYSVQAGPRAAGSADGLQARTAASGNQVVVAFNTPAVKPVPAQVSVVARGKSSDTWRRVEDTGNGAVVRARYDGFRAGVLAGNSGKLTLSHPPGAEPALAVVTVAYK
ncbi:hypothetical protein PI87_26785 [Ralstonia sp. A12]|uniref:hypothetical protein n=1 Tax=Ralstonia sp. A12 TaxID=1217052 RepID=UPI0005745C57|nr:hypothetical protein [Ralstonia sp. A12]KHK49202.1 hypothetical protein PI87_26785 [Ralstonia sp. A12]